MQSTRPSHMPLETFRSPLAGALLALALTACGSDPPPGTGPHEIITLPPEDGACGESLTSYPGDCLAPKASDLANGVVAHYGPRNYDDPDELSQFVIQPGGELVDCTYDTLSNDGLVHYNTYSVFSRPAMHHVILYAQPPGTQAGTHDDCEAKNHGASLLAVLQGGIKGDHYDYPPSGHIAKENEGLATLLEVHQMVAYEMHAVNPTDKVLLRENWTVFHEMPEDEVKGTVGQLAFNGGLQMRIPPHTVQTIQNSCTVGGTTGDIRVLDFFGHMHVHGQRFSAWKVSPTKDLHETRELVYESYDWSILDLIEFNSLVKNQPATYQSGKPGGASGDLLLNVGDRLDYECEMDNESDITLTFSARAYDGEMCNLFGSFTPGSYWSCVGN